MKIKEFLNISPEIHYLPEFDPKPETNWYGIKALWYEGAPYKNKKTKVFAYIGFPENITENVPAVVLIHGGGGHPYPEWIKRWNKNGFAAIAIDTTGYFPIKDWRGLLGTEEGKVGNFKHERKLYDELLQEGYTVAPDNSDMRDCDLPFEEQWMYFAVTDTILAHNILLNDNRIDNDKIGIVGISWGGVITSITIGYDTNFAFAIPIYGSAYLNITEKPLIPHFFSNKKVIENWNATDRLDNVKFPVLWLCWGYDAAFNSKANSMSYLHTKHTGSFLSIRDDLSHSHIRAWIAPEPYRYARKILCGDIPFVRVIEEPSGFVESKFNVEIPNDFIKVDARVCYLTEEAKYDENNTMISKWKSVLADVKNNTVIVYVPEEAYCYYVEFKGYTETECFVSTSSIFERN